MFDPNDTDNLPVPEPTDAELSEIESSLDDIDIDFFEDFE